MFFFIFNLLFANDGYRLWLKYDKIKDAEILENIRKSISGILVEGNSDIIKSADSGLQTGLKDLLNKEIRSFSNEDGNIVISKYSASKIPKELCLYPQLKTIGNEGYIISKAETYEKK